MATFPLLVPSEKRAMPAVSSMCGIFQGEVRHQSFLSTPWQGTYQVLQVNHWRSPFWRATAHVYFLLRRGSACSSITKKFFGYKAKKILLLGTTLNVFRPFMLGRGWRIVFRVSRNLLFYKSSRTGHLPLEYAVYWVLVSQSWLLISCPVTNDLDALTEFITQFLIQMFVLHSSDAPQRYFEAGGLRTVI